MRSRTGVALILGVAAGAAQAADHLLITEFVVTPTNGEFIEIYNPSESTVDLTDYWLSDAVSSNDNRYVDLVDGTASVFSSDFIAQFPAGMTLDPGGFLVVSMEDDSLFTLETGVVPDVEMIDFSGGTDAIPDMIDPGGLIGSSAGLTNTGEMAVLFYWDGLSDLVSDVDYMVYGDLAEATDKTGVAKDGPDADTLTTTYLNDTPIVNQTAVNVDGGGDQPHGTGFSAARAFPFDEVGEILTGGNGLGGHDETSEDLSINGNWNVHAAPTPGWVEVLTPPSISALAYAPCIPDAGETVTVSADVIDDDLAGVYLLVSLDGGATFDTTAMVNTVGDTYEGDTPALPAGLTVDFKVYAEDTGGLDAETWLYQFVVETFTSIATIQSDTTTDGASNYEGSAVNVAGYATVATGAMNDIYFFINADASADAWEGIKILGFNASVAVAEGDWVEIGGVVEEYYGETEVIAHEITADAEDCVMVVSSDAVDVKPLIRTSGVLADESYEGVLVTVNDSAVADTLTYGEWLIDDGSGAMRVDDAADYAYAPVIGDAIDVTGVVSYSFSNFKILPRDDADFDEVAFNIEIMQFDDVIGPGDRWDEYVTITNGTNAAVSFDSVDLDYVGPPTGTRNLYSGARTFPAGFSYSTGAKVPLPGNVPPTTFETSTIMSDAAVAIASDEATVIALPTDADVTVPTKGGDAPERKITGGGTVDWLSTVENTSGSNQTLTDLTAHVERWSHAAGDWVMVEDVVLFSGSQVISSGASVDYNGALTLAADDLGGRYRVRQTATFNSGIDSQTPLFYFRNDS